MLASTYAALRSQELSIDRLWSAACLNFDHGHGRHAHLPDRIAWQFWDEMLASRRAFRAKAGVEIESFMTDPTAGR